MHEIKGQNDLTRNITSRSDSDTFHGAKPSEIEYLLGVSSGICILGQLNNTTITTYF